MSRWSQDFSKHPFHTEWAALGVVLQGSSEAELEDTEEYARLKKVYLFMSGIIESMDPEIVSTNVLANMHPSVQNVLGEVVAYFANKNVQHLKNANAHMDSVVSIVVQSPLVAFGSAKTTLNKAATAYADTMRSYADNYKNRVDEIAASTVSDYEAFATRAATAEGTMSKLEGRITTMESALPQQLAGYNTDFQTSEKARADKFDSWTVAYQEKLDGQFEEAAKKFAAGQDAMGTFLDRAGKVLGSVVDTGQAGAYATYAGEEKKTANRFRISAIALMVAAAMVLFLPELIHATQAMTQAVGTYQMDWKSSLHRLPYSLILFAPALYLAKESAKHRTNEVLNRRRQHILTTIGPYLALLPADKAQQIKAEVAKSIFADNVPPMDERSADTANVLAQVTNLVDSIFRKAR